MSNITQDQTITFLKNRIINLEAKVNELEASRGQLVQKLMNSEDRERRLKTKTRVLKRKVRGQTHV